jgi:hypothetical protein
MKLNRAWQSGMTKVLLGAAIVISLLAVRGAQAGNEPVHLTTDWSRRHLIFTPPHTLAQQFKLSSNPRYVQQYLRRNAQKNAGQSDPRWRRAPEPVAKPLHRDWSTYIGYGGDPSNIVPATTGPGNYPAKYSFDPTAANCEVPAPPAGQQPDFIVFNTGLQGSASNVPYIDAGTVVAQPNQGDTVILADFFGNGITLTLTASTLNSNTDPGNNGFPGHSGTGTFDATQASTFILAQNIAAAINIPGNGSTFDGFGTHLSAVAVGNTVNLAFTTQAGFTSFANFPGFMQVTGSTTTNGPSIVWDFGKMVGGAAGIPTIVAIDNLYEGTCSSATPHYDGSTPLYYWSYNTGGQATTSPVLSADGSQVAFIQQQGNTGAYLVILKWRANSRDGSINPPLGTVQLPVTLTSQASAAAYRSCDPLPDPGGCMLAIPLNGGLTDTRSSPYYDYSNDVIYVGDDGGVLHKFTGVFKGTPAEVVVNAGGIVWPASVHAGNQLNSPVYNDNDGGIAAGTPGIFVTDVAGVLSRVDATVGSGTGGKISTAKLANVGFDDAPILDSTTGNVYAFARGDVGGGSAQRTGVYRFTVRFAAGATGAGSEAIVSTSSATQPTAFFTGDFDNIYYSSANGTGSMYVCSTNGGITSMWRIPVNAGVLGSPVPGPTIATADVDCSPVTEFNNGSTDRIFVSITGSPVTGGHVNCPFSTTGCVMSFDVTTSTGWNSNTPTSATESVVGGTSGIVVDNSSSAAGNSQIYFSPLQTGTCNPDVSPGNTAGLGGCGIQTSQNGLL